MKIQQNDTLLKKFTEKIPVALSKLRMLTITDNFNGLKIKFIICKFQHNFVRCILGPATLRSLDFYER